MMNDKKKYFIIIGILISLVVIIFIINAFRKQDVEHQLIADQVVEFYTSAIYDDTVYNNAERKALDDLLSTLTHQNEKIDLSKYLIEEDLYRTSKSNSNFVFEENGKCYIYYDDLVFPETENQYNNGYSNAASGDNAAVVICNGYEIYVFENDFIPYEEVKDDEKHSYQYLTKTIDSTIEKYYYASTTVNYYIEVTFHIDNKDVYNIEVNAINIEDIPVDEKHD